MTFHSLDVKACFSYTANPRSYSPRLSKMSHLFLPVLSRVGRLTPCVSLVCLAVAYSLEADAENRKKGLNSRAVFLGGGANSYNSKGTIVLGSQGKVECVTRQLSIQVAAGEQYLLDPQSLSLQHNVV